MTDQCVFCKIVQGDIPSQPVYEGEHFIVVNDIEPQAPVHVLFIPKQHFASLQDISPQHQALMGELMTAIPSVAKKLGVDEQGYKVIANTGKHGGQTVDHLHIHLLGGKQMPSLF